MDDKARIAKKLRDTQAFLGELGKYLDENFKLVGESGDPHSIKEWKEHFYVRIPDDINFSTIVELASDIFAKYQRAAYFRDKQIVQMSIMEQTKAEKFNTAYQNARTENERKFGKPLAAESCKVAATLEIKELEDAIQNQKVVKDFWNKTCDTLTELRKLIEIMSYALSADSRISRDMIVKEYKG